MLNKHGFICYAKVCFILHSKQVYTLGLSFVVNSLWNLIMIFRMAVNNSVMVTLQTVKHTLNINPWLNISYLSIFPPTPACRRPVPSCCSLWKWLPPLSSHWGFLFRTVHSRHIPSGSDLSPHNNENNKTKRKPLQMHVLHTASTDSHTPSLHLFSSHK